jgi:hypothetical protein
VNSLRRSAVALGLTALLTACGGGGGDGGDSGFVPPADDFNVFAAWRNLLTTSHAWTVSGIGSDGRSYTFTIAGTPGPTSVFPVTGMVSARADTQLTTNANGTIVAGTQETYFDAATLQLVGLRTVFNGSASACDIATAVDVPPAAVKVGTAGSLATLDELNGCAASSAKIGTITLTWSLEFEAGLTYFCSNSTERDPTGAVVSFEADCVRVSPDGTLGSAARVTVQQNGVTVIAR